MQEMRVSHHKYFSRLASRTVDSNRSTDAAPAKRKKVGGCPFYKQDLMRQYRDRVLVEVKDIEQLVTMGKESKACPYYGTRYAIPSAEIVALPYNTLLHKTTREACGIRLHGNVVIIDEAHNLLETINSVYSVEISGAQIFCAHSQVSQYLNRYRSRLKAKNLLYINQILFLLSKFVKCLGGNLGVPSEQQKISNKATRLWTINDFLFHSQVDNMNLFKIKRYCERSQISKKLHGFVEKYQPSLIPTESEKTEKDSPSTGLSTFLQEISQKKLPVEKSNDQDATATRSEWDGQVVRSSPLMLIEGFLAALTNADKDGRVLIQNQELLSRSSIKFLLLNPAVHFAEIINDARAVIVAGGTMQPISEFKSQLFHAAGVSPERILEYSCGHVIPGDHLLPLTVGQGPSGIDLDFTYQSRDRPELLDELGRLLCNICSAVPCGIVIFYPSYDYEKKVYEHWQKSGMLQRIATKKKVFREPKRAGQVDQILNEYADCIQKCSNNKERMNCSLTGAILLCVVGGKMSEGINFSDDLGRCIIMVGLPYPNIRSPELKEKMDYLNSNFPKSPDGRLPGQVHYENLCMKAVNQSIGRAIRHREDYAAILMLDKRYGKNSVASKLPPWIAKHLQKHDKFGGVYSSVIKFFNEKKKLRTT